MKVIENKLEMEGFSLANPGAAMLLIKGSAKTWFRETIEAKVKKAKLNTSRRFSRLCEDLFRGFTGSLKLG